MRLAVPEQAAASARAVTSGPRQSRTPAPLSPNHAATYGLGGSHTLNGSDANGADMTNSGNYYDGSNVDGASATAIPRTAGQQARKAKTKSELAALRRDMMKKKFKDGQALNQTGSLNRQTLADASVSYPS